MSSDPASSNPAVVLRRATSDDVAVIRDLTRAAYAKWIPAVGREPMPMKADYARAVREHRIDLLDLGGSVVGLIETMLREDHLWIENVAVVPDRQGQGWGRRLLAHAESEAAAAGRAELRLLTNALFGSNVAIYGALGYRVDREEPFEKGGVTVYMSKRIAP
jgi:ribosomal protein S18 acetylase RimI-like enzyme